MTAAQNERDARRLVAMKPPIVSQPLTLEEGKYYEDRQGRIIGPMRPAINGFRAYNGKMSFVWWVDGSAARGTVNPGDLIKEAVWEGPGTEPHEYCPSVMHMGNCDVCGHIGEAHTRYQPKES